MIKKFLLSLTFLVGLTSTVAEAQNYGPTVYHVDSMDELKKLTSASMAQYNTIELSGYYSGSQRGGGIFTWLTVAQASGLTPDGGVVIAPSDHLGTCSAGCIVKSLPSGYATQFDFGAKCDGTTDDSAAFTAMASFGKYQIVSGDSECLIAADVSLGKATFAGGILKLASDANVNVDAIHATQQQLFDVTGGGTVTPTSTFITSPVMPEWWGAKADGNTDDTLSIGSALGFAAAVTNGARVTLQCGVYDTSGNYTEALSGNGFQIVGSGRNCTTINHTGNNVFLTLTRSGSNMYQQPILRDLTISSSAGTSAYASAALKVEDAVGYGIEDIRIDNYSAGIDVILDNVTSWTEGFYSLNVQHDHSGIAYYFTRANSSPATASYYGLSLQNDYMSEATSRPSGSPTGTQIAFIYMGQDGFAKTIYGANISAHINPSLSNGSNAIFYVDGAGAANTNNILDGTFDIKSDSQGGNTSSNNALFYARDRTSSSLGKGLIYATNVNWDPYQGQPGYLYNALACSAPTALPRFDYSVAESPNTLSVDSFGIPQVVPHGITFSVEGEIGANCASITRNDGFLMQNSTYELSVSGLQGGTTPFNVDYLIQTSGTSNTSTVTKLSGTEPTFFAVTAAANSQGFTETINNSTIAATSTWYETLRMK